MIFNAMTIGITYPFLNFNGATVEVYEWILSFTPYIEIDTESLQFWTLL